MCCTLLVALSLADTLTMPLASMSKVTSIWGTPRGAGGMPSRPNLPSIRLSPAIGRSPWNTFTSTELWLSAAVEKVSLFLVGIVVLRGMSVVMTPPSVSMPSDSGVTSRSSMSLTSPESTPACTAAPSATTSSGLTPLCGSLPKNSLTSFCTIGMRVEPPTSTTSAMSDGFLPASASAFFVGSIVALNEIAHQLLELRARELDLHVLRPARVGCEERQVDLRLRDRRQLDLRLLGRLAQTLDHHLVLGDVDALVLLELGDQPVHDDAGRCRRRRGACRRWSRRPRRPSRRPRGWRYRTCRRRSRRHGDEVVLALVEPVGERRRGRLVDDALDVEAGDAARVLGRLALRIVEVGRDGDDRLGDLLAEVILGRLLELHQDARRDLGRASASCRGSRCRPRRSRRVRPCTARASISSLTSSNLRPMNRLIE